MANLVTFANENQHISGALYNFMCQHVGSEEIVQTRRLLTTVEDNQLYNENWATITSGSFGEGLEMKGSDFDFMYVLKALRVYENISDIELDGANYSFAINTHDTKLGFVKLLPRHSMTTAWSNLCVRYNNNLFLSNILFKQFFGNASSQGYERFYEVNHGPCLSDKYGKFDFAFCLHSKAWISQADHWRTRLFGSWPSHEVVSKVIEHGVLFVPIGVKGSPNEEIEWRISFSVGEKLLIYSFNHVQLLCYALMKIVLKDLINTDIRCKDLLCSYYLKNIVFWISEETLHLEWKPCNFIQCFMRCLKRLLYCVEYSLCPHYFIPENNMFENKITGQVRLYLLDNLHTLHNLGWRCILLSPRLKPFTCVNLTLTGYRQSFAEYFAQIHSSAALKCIFSDANYDTVVRGIISNQSTSIKRYHVFFLLHSCKNKAGKIDLSHTDTNKKMYGKYKTCQSYIVQGLRCDGVSGWLILASLYYRIKQYRKVLDILAYAVSKCTKEMFYGTDKLTYVQHQILVSKTLQRKGSIRILQLLRLENVCFRQTSTLIPQELEFEILNRHHVIPPVVFANFLSFLCHYHLNDVREYRNSLDDLHLTISQRYFASGYLSASYNILGVVLQIIGENDSAMRAFLHAVALDSWGTRCYAKQRLSMMTKGAI